MNMSGPYSGYFSGQPFGQPNQHQPYFAEYSLWGSSPFRPEPAQLFSPIIRSGVFGQQLSPNPAPEPERNQPLVQEPPDVDHALPEAAIKDEPDTTGLDELLKRVINKEALYKHPDNFYFDLDSNQDTEVESNSSGSSTSADWTHSNFQRAGASSSYPWVSRPFRGFSSRGKKANVMQRRLVKALSQPVKMDKGASMMQRMGWLGGGLGRDGSGIVDPVEPNAVYATTTIGFGQEVQQIQQLSASRSNRASCVKKQRCKKTDKINFRSNVLLHLLDFVKDDLQVELYFDTKLKSSERKGIHRMVGTLNGNEEEGELVIWTSRQEEMIKDIKNRMFYQLSTQSDGEGTSRQLCVFKVAPCHMFLITPEDCRPALTDIKEVEEDTNPFLKSITKHIKKEEGSVDPAPPHLFDMLVDYFIDFSIDVYTELRFLGPFTKKEIFVINNFVSLINDLSKKSKPCFHVPVELLDVFSADYTYAVNMDINGFVSIKRSTETLKEKAKQEADAQKNAAKND